MLPKDLLTMENISSEAVADILERAAYYKKQTLEGRKFFNALKGKSVAISFWEPSTRTRTSFELAVKRLGGEVVDYIPELGSEQKGEALEDTISTLISIGIDGFVFRHKSGGVISEICPEVPIPFISGGEGCFQHPTQALLDIFTLQEEGVTLNGLYVVMVGDILYSRVARSHFYALPALGAQLHLVAPPAFLPPELPPPEIIYTYNLRKALLKADVIYLLRVQQERQERKALPSLKEYSLLYGLQPEDINLVRKEAFLMHPGPVHMGVEISREFLQLMHKFRPGKILFQKQVQNGVFVRMAVLDLFLGREAS